MRWSGQLIDAGDEAPAQGALFDAASFEGGAVARTFDTPGFRGATFSEVRAKSVLNRVPGEPSFFQTATRPTQVDWNPVRPSLTLGQWWWGGRELRFEFISRAMSGSLKLRGNRR